MVPPCSYATAHLHDANTVLRQNVQRYHARLAQAQAWLWRAGAWVADARALLRWSPAARSVRVLGLLMSVAALAAALPFRVVLSGAVAVAFLRHTHLGAGRSVAPAAVSLTLALTVCSPGPRTGLS